MPRNSLQSAFILIIAADESARASIASAVDSANACDLISGDCIGRSITNLKSAPGSFASSTIRSPVHASA